MGPVDCSQKQFLVHIEPFPDISGVGVFSEVVSFQLQKALLKTFSFDQMFEIRIVKSLFSSKRNFPFNILKEKKM